MKLVYDLGLTSRSGEFCWAVMCQIGFKEREGGTSKTDCTPSEAVASASSFAIGFFTASFKGTLLPSCSDRETSK